MSADLQHKAVACTKLHTIYNQYMFRMSRTTSNIEYMALIFGSQNGLKSILQASNLILGERDYAPRLHTCCVLMYVLCRTLAIPLYKFSEDGKAEGKNHFAPYKVHMSPNFNATVSIRNSITLHFSDFLIFTGLTN